LINSPTPQANQAYSVQRIAHYIILQKTLTLFQNLKASVPFPLTVLTPSPPSKKSKNFQKVNHLQRKRKSAQVYTHSQVTGEILYCPQIF
jgi:hypothetical protein